MQHQLSMSEVDSFWQSGGSARVKSRGERIFVERTIALRPYPAVKLFRDALYASLKDKLPPDVWDYPAS
jgi:hypothetical protein